VRGRYRGSRAPPRAKNSGRLWPVGGPTDEKQGSSRWPVRRPELEIEIPKRDEGTHDGYSSRNDARRAEQVSTSQVARDLLRRF